MFISKTKRAFNKNLKEDSAEIGNYDLNKYGNIGIKAKIDKGGGSNLFKFLNVNNKKQPVFQSSSPRFSKKGKMK